MSTQNHNFQTENGFNPFRLGMKNKKLSWLVEKVLGLDYLAKRYDIRPAMDASEPVKRAAEFLDYTMSVLDFTLSVNNPELLDKMPKQGPLIIVSNHPLGGLEGVAITRLLLNVRPDIKVLTNQLLTRIPELQPLFIGVDVLSGNASKENARGMRAACKHLETGGALLIFPSGMVSTINPRGFNPLRWRVEDRTWNTLVGRLVRRFNTPCVPLYVNGKNGPLFHLLGLIHKRLRTAMLARELGNKKGKTFTLQIGELISQAELQQLPNDKAITNYLRIATDLQAREQRTEVVAANTLPPVAAPIISAEQLQMLLSDLHSLEDCRLRTQNNFSVYCAPYARLGSVMTAIARARESTFRAAGEGTGKELDSDRFDPYYDHLFVWDDEANCIVGGYRLGRSDEIVAERGIRALYSRSLYHFDGGYLARLGTALEVGRSFVAPEYQRHPRALDMLWQGIGAYVLNNPKYHTLFGCVSISREHSELARAFLSDSMMESFRAEQQFLSDVRPVAPLRVKGKLWTAEILASLGDIAIINKLLGRCDPGKTIPILLRHYLNLNGRFVCFSLNTGFNNSLDGLILVDLRKTPEKYLRRYLGKAGCEQFLKQWNLYERAA